MLHDGLRGGHADGDIEEDAAELVHPHDLPRLGPRRRDDAEPYVFSIFF